MDHENQLKKHRYRNWVKSGLSLKYLKDGIIGFVDESIKIEHTRILKVVNQTHISACNVCNYRNLKPNHACYKDTQTGRLSCPRGQFNCNCLDKKKKPCPNKVCDIIFEEILGCHSSSPPAPNWRNSDIHKWSSNPLEIAKCYINAPGYADKITISDIDVQGLLQILIHNISLHSNLACDMTVDNVFNKTLHRRNTLFHSPSMEMEDKELNECIDEIIAILEDKKALKRRSDSIQAVLNIKQLKQKDFHITTSSEAEVCKEAMAAITSKTSELTEMANTITRVIDKSKRETESRHASILLELQTKENTMKSQRDENAEAIQNIAHEQQEQGNQVECLDLRVSSLESRVTKVETDTSELSQRLEEVKGEVNALNTIRDLNYDHLEYIKQKQDLQERLVDRYKTHYVKTSICPLKTQVNDVEISEVYTSPEMMLERNTTDYETIDKMPARRLYKDIFQTGDRKNRRIYILGEAGSGKSSFCKMMLHNWFKCFDVTKETTRRQTSTSRCFHDLSNFENINEIKGFQFLFFIPLYCMSGFSNDIYKMIESITEDIATKQMIDKIFATESEQCLIIIDGLDEWNPAKDDTPVLPHATQGKPKLNQLKDATVILLSRPSARGILNMKSSESDLKIHLFGIPCQSIDIFIEKYMTKLNKMYSFHSFLQMIAETKLKNLEKTPMLLQQILWMYCYGEKIGNSTSDLYSRIVNTMLAWYDEKQNEGGQKIDITATADSEHQNWQLPKLLSRYPRCISNKSIIFLLSKIAFQTLISAKSTIFSRSELKQTGLSDVDISTVLKLGLVCEENCFDPSYERTQLSFTHKSFLECFAAIYITSHCSENKQSIQMHQESNIDKLFKDMMSVDDILQLENMLILVSGFSPYLITRMSEHIYEAVLKDKQLDQYRKMPFRDRIVSAHKGLLVQRLISKFATEAELNGLQGLTLQLCDIQLCRFTEPILLQNIITEKVLSLNVFTYEMKRCEFKSISAMRQIQSIYINHDITCLPHECCDMLASFLSQTDTLRSIHLLGVTCQMVECDGHTFDLSRNHELQTICVKCDHMCVSKISTSALESFIVQLFDLCQNTLSRSLLNSLSEAEYLKNLHIEGMEDGSSAIEHKNIDCSRHEQLKHLKIEDCKYLSISNVYSTTLQSCVIENCILSHSQCILLTSALQKTSLKELVLNYIRCDQKCCEGHIINVKQIQSLKMRHCESLCVSAISKSNVRSCKIADCIFTHEQYALCSALLSQSPFLSRLILIKIQCKLHSCEGHSIDLTHCDEIETLTLDKCERLFITAVCSSNLRNCNVEKFLSFSRTDRNVVLCKLELNDFKSAQDLPDAENVERPKYRKTTVISKSVKEISVHETRGSDISTSMYLCENPEHITSFREETQNLAFLLFSHECLKHIENVPLLSCTIKDCYLPHNQYTSLLLKLAEAAFLQRLELRNIRCGQNLCNGHSINIVKLTDLREFSLTECKSLSVSHVCSVKLSSYMVKGCIFSEEHGTKLLTYMSNCDSLHQLVIQNTTFEQNNRQNQPIDISKLHQLQRLVLIRCTNLRVSNINTSVLTDCDIRDCTFSHEQYTAFTSSLRSVCRMSYLCLNDVKCSSGHQCEGHSIDLSNTTHLTTLKIRNCGSLLIVGFSSKSLDLCWIDSYTLFHGESNSLLSSIEQAVALRCLKICNTRLDKSETEEKVMRLTKQRRLQYLTLMTCNALFFSDMCSNKLRYLKIYNQVLTHENCLTLSSVLEQAVSVKRLHISQVQCREDLCEGHMINVTKTAPLTSIKIHRCKHIYISRCPSRLREFRLNDCRLPHEAYECLAESLMQTKSLTMIELNNIKCLMEKCDGHIIDLSKCKELHILESVNCKQLSISDVCSKTIHSCRISNSRTSHEQFEILLSSLAESTMLAKLELTNVQCNQNKCNGHNIDLSKHPQLHSVSFVCCKRLCAFNINGNILGSFTVRGCVLSHEECTILSTTLTQMKGLKKIEVGEISCNQDGCEGHAVDLSEHKELQNVTFRSCNHLFLSGIYCSGITCFSVDVYYCEKNHYLKVLSSLSEAIFLRKLQLNVAHCSHAKSVDHASLNLVHCRSLRIVNILNLEYIPILNVEKLEICSFTNCVLQHDQYTLLCSSFQQAIHLRQIIVCKIKCTQPTCNGHNIDLTSHTQLNRLTVVDCERLHVSGFNSDVLESCVVRDCEFPHKQCEILVSFLRGAVTLQRLTLGNVRCAQDMCEGHTLDLLKLTHLKNLALASCKHFYVSGVTSRVLESCTIQDLDISHQKYSNLLTNLTDPVLLKHLKLYNIKCLSNDECTGHTMSISKLARMQSLIIMSCKHLRVSNITSKALEVFTHSDSVILHEQLNQLAAFLATAFSLKRLKLHSIRCSLEGCEGHAVDLSNLQQLQYLVLENCEQLYRVNTK